MSEGIQTAGFVNSSSKSGKRPAPSHASAKSANTKKKVNEKGNTKNSKQPKGNNKKKGKAKKVWFVIGLVLFALVGSVAATAKHKIVSTLGLMNHNTKNDLDSVDLSGINLKFDKDVINILLVGVDNSKERDKTYGECNNTDTMMIATMDLKHNKLKLTSLMRDLYMPIAEPRNTTDKLNSAYAAGGIDCLYKTIAQNFNIKMDGYAIVNLDAFTSLVNEIGGVELTLTYSEAHYLNNTNYIKKTKYRNLKEPVKGQTATQVLNGYQAMGYCQIRHGKKLANGKYPAVISLSGVADDYARTERQRLFMQALFKKVKGMPLSKWMSLVEVILPNITSDLSNDEIYKYMVKVVQMGTTEINQFRIPVNGMFSSPKIRGQYQLVPDITANRNALYDFIYSK